MNDKLGASRATLEEGSFLQTKIAMLHNLVGSVGEAERRVHDFADKLVGSVPTADKRADANMALCPHGGLMIELHEVIDMLDRRVNDLHHALGRVTSGVA